MTGAPHILTDLNGHILCPDVLTRSVTDDNGPDLPGRIIRDGPCIILTDLVDL